MILTSFDDGFWSSQLAGSGAAHLQVELSDSFPVEHGVEGGNLIDVHLVDFCDFGYFAHGGDWQEVLILFLCEGQQRNNGGSFPIAGVFG